MKFRIQGNYIRIRLTQGEVASLGAGQKIEQTTQFSSNSKLVSSVEPSTRASVATATFDGTHLIVRLPLEAVKHWANSEQVGIEATQSIDRDDSLRLLIEKDFECLHKDDEHTPDAFPNPRLA
jgi:hypothetical protein